MLSSGVDLACSSDRVWLSVCRTTPKSTLHRDLGDDHESESSRSNESELGREDDQVPRVVPGDSRLFVRDEATWESADHIELIGEGGVDESHPSFAVL